MISNCLNTFIQHYPHLNLPCLSARSDERQVRSTENLSRLTVRIRQCIVIPTYMINITIIND